MFPITALPVSPAHHPSLDPRWPLLIRVPSDELSYSKLQEPLTARSKATPRDSPQPRALGCICVTPCLQSISMITGLVSSALLQPEWTGDKELPVETDHRMLEATEEALQIIRCDSPTRGSATETHQPTGSVFPVLLTLPASAATRGFVIPQSSASAALRRVPAFPLKHRERLGQQNHPGRARCERGATDTQCRTVSATQHK